MWPLDYDSLILIMIAVPTKIHKCMMIINVFFELKSKEYRDGIKIKETR